MRSLNVLVVVCLLGGLFFCFAHRDSLFAQPGAPANGQTPAPLAPLAAGVAPVQIPYPVSCDIRNVSVDNKGFYHLFLQNKLSGRLFIKIVKVPEDLYTAGFLEVVPVSQ